MQHSDIKGYQAVILAGGKGVRLRPYTTNIPKPLVPIGDQYSILEIVLRQLVTYGFTHVTLAIGHLGHIIRAYVGDGSAWGIQVDYLTEDSPLGTMGPLLMMRDRLPDHFLVMNGDVLTDLDYGHLLQRHMDSDAPVTVATYEREIKIDFGVLDISDNQVKGFKEKPTLGYAVSMGIYGMSRSTLDAYTPGLPFGFDDLMHDLLRGGTLPNSYGFGGYWLDIGRPDDYDRANEEFLAVKEDLLPSTRTLWSRAS